MKGQTADVVGRPSRCSSFLGDPGAIFFWGKAGTSIRKEKRAKKGLWKLTPLWESAKSADSHSGLKRASQTTLGFFTVPTGPTAGSTQINQ
jgi:hypothetical protein